MEEKISTKEKIIAASLELFSQRGYDGVSMRDIAAAVGIKGASIYNHFKGKEAIFEAILEKMEQRYKEQAVGMQLDGAEADRDVKVYAGISEERLLQMGKNLFLYFLHDEYAGKFRKMLTIEQFRNEKLASVYSRQYGDDPLAYQGMLFDLLMKQGELRQENPKITALHFYAPIYFMLSMCDRQPQREEEALEMLEQHILQFNRIYGK